MQTADAILTRSPWLMEKNLNCILSPDSDGFLSALLMTNVFHWRVAGFYDGKILALDKSLSAKDCVFLDMEINRPVRGSIGHHLISFNNRMLPIENFSFPHCIQPNEQRRIDGTQFQRKYPYGTVHLLISLLHSVDAMPALPHTSSTPLLFTDGVWNNVFGYTENCIDWYEWLGISNTTHPLYSMFNRANSVYAVMKDLDAFCRMRDTFNAKGMYKEGEYTTGGRTARTGDKLRLSEKSGRQINLVNSSDAFDIHPEERERIAGFITKLGALMNLPYLPERWTWGSFRVSQFEKAELKNPTQAKVRALFNSNPVSLAMTSSTGIEHTLDPQGGFFPN